MPLPSLRMIGTLFLAVVTPALPLQADTGMNSPPPPGTLNYVEGQASIGALKLDSKSVGSTDLEKGQSLTTTDGKAEVLLTPGVFLRLGSNSTVKMLSPTLTDTEVHLEKGHAMIEVAEIHPENDLRVVAGGATIRMLKTGLYDIDLNHGQLRVFDGKASVLEGDQNKDVGGGHEITLAANADNAKLKARKFNKKSHEDGDLYRWSSLRSSYLAEANVDAAGLYSNDGTGPWGTGWWGADWYWDPYYDSYTFIPGDGIFYSPFGWGFYSPWWVSEAPFYPYGGYGYGGYGYGGYGGYGNYGGPGRSLFPPGRHPVYHHFSTDVRNWGGGQHYAGSPNYSHGIYRGAGSMGGFRSGPQMMSGNLGGGGRRFGGGGMRAGGFGGTGFHGGGIHAGGFGGGGFGGGGFHGGGFHGGVGFHGGGGFHGR